MNIIYTTDIHGCWFTLTRLLNVIPKPFQLIFGGDLIDRGPHSRKVIEFAMENSIPTCGGNHCDLCVAFYRGSRAHCHHLYDRGVWLDNGGDVAATNWNTFDKRGTTDIPVWEMRRDKRIGGRVPDNVLDWMEKLPAYIIPDAPVDENGRRLLISHTGYGLHADVGDWHTALWGRRGHDRGAWKVDLETGEAIDDGYFRVYGHTRVEKVRVEEDSVNIDSGAAYGKYGFGHLTAFMWPSKQIFTVPYDESPVKPAFKVAIGGCISSN